MTVLQLINNQQNDHITIQREQTDNGSKGYFKLPKMLMLAQQTQTLQFVGPIMGPFSMTFHESCVRRIFSRGRSGVRDCKKNAYCCNFITGCSLNIVFFPTDFRIFQTLSLFPLGVSVCTPRGVHKILCSFRRF